jgi:DNA-binding GntR family transcriptional regulator
MAELTRAPDGDPLVSTADRLAALGPRWAVHSAEAGAADAVYATLREAIMDSGLRPGDGLIEEHVARQFGVSRTPVREALQRLMAEGLAKPVGRRGLVVRSVSDEEMVEVYSVRSVLDGLAARLAASAALPAEITHLRWVNDKIREAAIGNDARLMSALSLEFHTSLARAAHNGLVAQFNDEILNRVRRFTSSVFTYPERSMVMVQEHDKLIAALEAHDPNTAERVAREHVSNTYRIRVEILHKDDGQRG